jgi:hypothetical protein|tara:strand:- start:56 stop:652 length:597 start_codon:yes stop_codon:yes gene_type:complete
MKIFVLGYNKSGTKSLTDALQILGYKVLDTGITFDKFFTILDNIKSNIENQNPILHNLDDYDCYVDYPFFEPIVFSHLVNENPTAKYISLTRDLDEYVDSVLRHKIRDIKNKHYNSWNWLGVGDEKTFENYPTYQKKWMKEKAYFKHTSNLLWLKKLNITYLEMNITQGDGWDKLCPYLNKDIPDTTFPHSNKGSLHG